MCYDRATRASTPTSPAPPTARRSSEILGERRWPASPTSASPSPGAADLRQRRDAERPRLDARAARQRHAVDGSAQPLRARPGARRTRPATTTPAAPPCSSATASRARACLRRHDNVRARYRKGLGAAGNVARRHADHAAVAPARRQRGDQPGSRDRRRGRRAARPGARQRAAHRADARPRGVDPRLRRTSRAPSPASPRRMRCGFPAGRRAASSSPSPARTAPRCRRRATPSSTCSDALHRLRRSADAAAHRQLPRCALSLRADGQGARRRRARRRCCPPSKPPCASLRLRRARASARPSRWTRWPRSAQAVTGVEAVQVRRAASGR